MTNSAFARRPNDDEYDAFYATYISKVPKGDVLQILRQQLDAGLDLFRSIPEEKVDFRYAEGKWTTREVIGHVVDAERVFSYRALTIARGDSTPLPGMDQNVFMAGAGFASRPIASMVDEYHHLRAANLALFGSFDEATLDRTGIASGCPITVRASIYIIAGHERHHMAVLRQRYL